MMGFAFVMSILSSGYIREWPKNKYPTFILNTSYSSFLLVSDLSVSFLLIIHTRPFHFTFIAFSVTFDPYCDSFCDL